MRASHGSPHTESRFSASGLRMNQEYVGVVREGRPSKEVRDEIERAIANAKRTAWDKWFRKQWYRAAWQRERSAERRQRAEAQDLSPSCPASR
jgi:hypothetical protein